MHPVVAMRIDTRIGCKSHQRSSLKSFAEILPLRASDLALFSIRFLQHAVLRAFREDVIVVVDVEIEICVMLLRESNAFIIDEAAMLDGVDAGENRILDGLRAMRVRRHFSSELMRFLGDCPQLLLRK